MTPFSEIRASEPKLIAMLGSSHSIGKLPANAISEGVPFMNNFQEEV